VGDGGVLVASALALKKKEFMAVARVKEKWCCACGGIGCPLQESFHVF
jgi:hypothetical protein